MRGALGRRLPVLPPHPGGPAGDGRPRVRPGRRGPARFSRGTAGVRNTRAHELRKALATRVVVADGAMGTMLQAQDPTLEDFENLE
ncbi:hypothetical protein, partial [Streptomyces canus]|uniref:hypothetical protein n=1 Tax=Streptomyces canus TaxID=58343 RepID=UPI003F57171E